MGIRVTYSYYLLSFSDNLCKELFAASLTWEWESLVRKLRAEILFFEFKLPKASANLCLVNQSSESAKFTILSIVSRALISPSQAIAACCKIGSLLSRASNNNSLALSSCKFPKETAALKRTNQLSSS